MAKALQELLLNFEPLEFVDSVEQQTHKISDSLFETIAITEQKAQNLAFHQNRVDRAFKEFYRCETNLILQEVVKSYLSKIEIEKNRKYRLKIIYNREGILSSNHYSYQKKFIQKLQIVEVTNIKYSHKYSNRSIFESIIKSCSADECIISKNGYIADTIIANIALFHTNLQEWHTPTTPLLHGTTRERLLQSQELHTKAIHYRDLKNYSKIALLNAMVGFYIL